jgi:dystonin
MKIFINFNYLVQAAEQVRSLKPVSSEVEQIRAQQKDFGELRRRTLEPVGQNVAQCNKIGQGLVRSALQGVSTNQLEKDLEKMNDKWNALKETVSKLTPLSSKKEFNIDRKENST